MSPRISDTLASYSHTSAPSAPPTGLTPEALGLPKKFVSYRLGQDHVAVDVAASQHRFSFVAAPTGSGKTAIYMTIAKLIGARVLVLVGTKGLQHQVLSEFKEIGAVEIKGRQNYRCPMYGDCDGPNRADEVCDLTRDKQCTYLKAVGSAAGSEIVIANYAYWMALARFERGESLGDFDLLVCDEAHTAEEWLTGLVTVEIDRRDMKSVLPDLPLPAVTASFDDWKEWATLARIRLGEKLKLGGIDPAERRSRMKKLHRALLEVVESLPTTHWAVDEVKNSSGVGTTKIQIAPVRPAEFAERYLFRGIPRVVLTSATLTPDTPRYLGVDPLDMDYREVGNGFDPRRRPLIYVPRVRVDYRMDEGNARILQNAIDSVIGARLDRKGIIHARSYARMRDLVAKSKWRDLFHWHSAHDARETIEAFRRAPAPAILVSPSVEEGFDFHGDECRYQIIAKVPFVDARSTLMKARKAEEPGYVNYLAALSLIQMVGRGTRSEEDWCETFIFDTHWAWFRNKVKFPNWFRAGWRQTADLPVPLEFPDQPTAEKGARVS